MLKETIFDPTDKGTLCLKAKPLQAKGDHFEPIKLLNFS
jgi:hypothetical protein